MDASYLELLSAAGSSGKQSYWIGTLGGTSNDLCGSSAVDAAGNLFLCGTSNASGSNNFQLAKYNTSGVLQWQKRLGNSGVSSTGNGITLDASGNIYVCGSSNASGTTDFEIAKYDSSGTLQWQRSLGGLSGSGSSAYSIAVGSSGNIYVYGYSYLSGISYFQLAKYNSSGVLQWQSSIGNGLNNNPGSTGNAIALDAYENIYIVGSDSTGGAGYLVKFDTNGVIQWQTLLLVGPNNPFLYAIKLDALGNIYICGSYYDGSITSALVMKLDSTGAIQWQRLLGAVGSSNTFASIALDLSGNIYTLGTTGSDLEIAKYNNSGTIQWQRKFGGSRQEFSRFISVDASGNIYISSQYSIALGNGEFLFAKLPGNGSLTGTYTVGTYSITYAASTLTDSAATVTEAASLLVSASTTLTDATSSLTSATSTRTSTVTQI